MQCRYCNQRLNIFKSLAGSGFCSKEHQELFEKSQAETAFSRLLQFVEKDPKPARSPAPSAAIFSPQPPAPAVPAAPQPIENVSENTLSAETPAPPLSGFIAEPSPVPAGANILPARAASDIVASPFSAQLPALSPWRIELRQAELNELPAVQPDPEAAEKSEEPAWAAISDDSDAHPSFVAEPIASTPDFAKPGDARSPDPVIPPVAPCLSGPNLEIQGPQACGQILGIRAVRPRALDPRQPSPSQHLPVGIGGSALPSVERAFVHPANRELELPNLARLNPIAREIQAEIDPPVGVQAPAAPALLAVQSEPGAADLIPSLNGPEPSPKPPIRMAGAVIRAILGRTRTRFSSQTHSPARPALPNPPPPEPATLPGIFLKTRPGTGRSTVPGNNVLPSTGSSKAVIQPKLPAFEPVGLLAANHELCPIQIEAQNDIASHDRPVAPALAAQCRCVLPAKIELSCELSATAALLASPQLRPKRDAVRSVPIQPAFLTGVSRPPCVPLVSNTRFTPAISADRASRAMPPRSLPAEAPKSSISSARIKQQPCVLPQIQSSAETSLGSAAPVSSDLDKKNYISKPFEAFSQAQAATCLCLASRNFQLREPAVILRRNTRQLAFEAVDDSGIKVQAAGDILRIKPATASALRLVARPRPGAKAATDPHLAYADGWAGILVPATTGGGTRFSLSTPAEEPERHALLPRPAAPGVSRTHGLTPKKALNSSVVMPSDRKASRTPAAASPTPLRVQPASMLVLPGPSILGDGSTRWVRAGWAAIRTAGIPGAEQDNRLLASSLVSLGNALRLDRLVPQTTGDPQLDFERSAILLNLSTKTPAPRVLAASALPRRRGPTLPTACAELDELVVADT